MTKSDIYFTIFLVVGGLTAAILSTFLLNVGGPTPLPPDAVLGLLATVCVLGFMGYPGLGDVMRGACNSMLLGFIFSVGRLYTESGPWVEQTREGLVWLNTDISDWGIWTIAFLTFFTFCLTVLAGYVLGFAWASSKSLRERISRRKRH